MVQALANPSVRINNVTVSIVPNSFVPNLGLGEINTRAASAGGNSVVPVHTVNAETKISTWTFEIFPTPDNIKSIAEWKNNVGRNAISAIEDLGEDGALTLSLTSCSLINDPDLNLSSDGTISLEWKGAQAVIG